MSLIVQIEKSIISSQTYTISANTELTFYVTADNVRSVALGGISQAMDIKEFDIFGDLAVIPSVPVNLQVSGSYDSASLSWDAVPGADSYNIYDNGVLLGNSISNSYTISGLSAGDHSFTVSAVNSSGESAQSSAVIFTATVPPSPPSAPTNLMVSNITHDSAVLSWDSVPDATSYKVYSGVVLLIETNNTSYTLSGLTPETSYNLAVSAVNSAGESSQTGVSFSTISAPPPPVPGVFDGTSVNFGVKLLDVLAGIALIFVKLVPLVILGIVVAIVFKLANNTLTFGHLVDGAKTALAGGVRRGARGKSYFGNRKRSKTVGKKSVSLARRSTRKTLGGKRLARRSVAYGVKKVESVARKRRKRQQKYGTYKLGYLTNSKARRKFSSSRSVRPYASSYRHFVKLGSGRTGSQIRAKYNGVRRK